MNINIIELKDLKIILLEKSSLLVENNGEI